MKIDHPNSFANCLKNGINLFTGAGFSILPDKNGKKLPLEDDLVPEVKAKFDLPASFSSVNKLGTISTFIEATHESEYQDFLRSRFHVDSYNALYDVLNKVNLKSYITTNIDNIFQLVIEKGTRYYLNDVKAYGRSIQGLDAVDFLALHGNCASKEDKLYFGDFEIGNAANENGTLFRDASERINKYPTLMMGYGMHDSSVITFLGKVILENRTNIWILCHDDASAALYRQMGFQVIEGDTKELLKYVNSLITDEDNSTEAVDISRLKAWKKYKVPDKDDLKENVSLSDYFRYGCTSWNIVLNSHPYESTFLQDVLDESLAHKNVVICGIPQGGKTTLLMQCSRRQSLPTFYFSNLSVSQAKFLCKDLNTDIVICIDDFARDMEAYRVFAENKFIHTIAVANEFEYESASHLLDDVDICKLEMPDLLETDARKCFQTIPEAIRNSEFKYSAEEGDRYGMPEFLTDNVAGVISEKKVSQILQRISDSEVMEAIILTAYLTNNHSYLSMDVLFEYFGKSYSEINDLLKKTNQILSEIDIDLEPDQMDQDYYRLRSHIFTENVHNVAKKRFNAEYSHVVKKIIKEVNLSVIYRADIFKRGAFDARFIYDIFGKAGKEFYELLTNYDYGPYTYQQKALFEDRCNEFSQAFSDIDKAATLAPYNFSIRNAKAIIIFDANSGNTSQAAEGREKAMAILEQCYHSDKRKGYHARKYGEFALTLYKEFNNDTYLSTALKWIDESIDLNMVSKNSVKRLRKDIKDALSSREI